MRCVRLPASPGAVAAAVMRWLAVTAAAILLALLQFDLPV